VAWCDLSVLTTDNDDVDDGISIFSCQAVNDGRWSNGEDHLRGGSCSHVHGPFSIVWMEISCHSRSQSVHFPTTKMAGN
jgi:hypothetical protein